MSDFPGFLVGTAIASCIASGEQRAQAAAIRARADAHAANLVAASRDRATSARLASLIDSLDDQNDDAGDPDGDRRRLEYAARIVAFRRAGLL